MITLFSPAKVNLFLQVRGKRPDGFHELASLFQAISLGDILSFSLSEYDTLQIDSSYTSIKDFPLLKQLHQYIPVDNTNLILKAVELFRQKTGIHFFVKVVLNKRVPVQAGLGGGSSNAATTLFAINELLNHPLSFEDLIEMSKQLGSDVTFFFSSATAFFTGRGEIFENLPPLNISCPCYIAKPSFGLSTPLVFKNFELSHCKNVDAKKVLEDFYNGRLDFFNDLETAAFKVEPRLKPIKKMLLDLGFEKVVMSGSGTAFFCLGTPKSKPQINLALYPMTFVSRKKNAWYDFFDYHVL